MELKPGDIVIVKCRSWNPMDWFIWKHTSSWWGHCAVVKNKEGDLFDPRTKGIENNNISKYKDRGHVVRRYKYDFNEANILKWCYEKQAQAKSYDFVAILGFVTGVKAFNDQDTWYCSEFPYWMFMDNGYKLTDEEMAFIYPDFFMKSNDFITIV